MMRIRLVLGIALLALPTALHAQQTQPQQQQPGILVVSQQKCNLGALEEVTAYFRANAAPILNSLVQQDRLQGWGLLEHNWGDEWNNVVYYTARDLATFQAAFNDYFRQLLQKDPKAVQTIARHCSEHRDNIYRVVLTQNTPLR